MPYSRCNQPRRVCRWQIRLQLSRSKFPLFHLNAGPNILQRSPPTPQSTSTSSPPLSRRTPTRNGPPASPSRPQTAPLKTQPTKPSPAATPSPGDSVRLPTPPPPSQPPSTALVAPLLALLVAPGLARVQVARSVRQPRPRNSSHPLCRCPRHRRR